MGGPAQFEGHSLDDRTRDMVIAARVVTDAPLVITQGCYNAGGVAASAGTHDGGGAVDIRARDLTGAQIAEAVLKLRHVGFAAWHRTPAQGNWVEHIHCIAIGCPDLSSGAAYQVTAYKNGRNGLANNGKDDGPRTYVGWTWEKYKKAYPDLLTEDTLSAADVKEIKNYIEARLQAYSGWEGRHTDQVVAALEGKIDDIVQKELEEYGSRLLAAPTGTGTKFMDEVRTALAAQSRANAELAQTLTVLAAKVDALPK